MLPHKGAVSGSVGGNTADVGGRAATASEVTAPVGRDGVSSLSVDTNEQLGGIQGSAQAGVDRPDAYHVIDSGGSFSVADRRAIDAADRQNADALITGGERSNIQIGDDTFVPTYYENDQAVYAVERDGGHAYYTYGGDGEFEPASSPMPSTQGQIDAQANNGPTQNATAATINRVQVRRGSESSEEPSLTKGQILIRVN